MSTTTAAPGTSGPSSTNPSTSGAATSSGGDSSSTGGDSSSGDTGAPPECDPLVQNCGNDEKCQPGAGPGGIAICVPAPAVGGDPGDPCMVDNEGIDDCAAGGFCTELGECAELCSLASGCPGPEEECFTITGPGLCLPTCDALLQNCNFGGGCYLGDETYVCLPEGAVGRGGDCVDPNDCALGSLCILGTCSRVCDLSSGDIDCDIAQACEAVLAAPPPGLADIGACVAP